MPRPPQLRPTREPVEYKPHGIELPSDLRAERAVLASALLDNSAMTLIEPHVAPGDFYDPRHMIIFEVFVELNGVGERIDVITVCHALRQRERLNTVGGAQYVGELTDEIPTIAHCESHARIVADLAAVRRVLNAAMTVVMRGLHNMGEVKAFLDGALAEITTAVQRREEGQFVKLEDAIIEAFKRIENMETGQRILGTPTGFHELDALTGGLAGGQLIIIAARPAMGKTSLVLNICMHAATMMGGRPVVFFSLEMPCIELVNRALCAEGRVDLLRLRTGNLSQSDISDLTRAANSLHPLPVLVNDAPGLTPVELRAGLRRLAASGKPPALVIIDYLQLMRQSRSATPAADREKEMSNITRDLKVMAKEFNVPIIALSQLNRNVETRPGKNRRPILADLRESGAIEQDADVVMFIYRDEVYNKDSEHKGIAELILAKQRNGPTDTVRLRFLNSLTLFENLAKPEESRYEEHADNLADNDFPSF